MDVRFINFLEVVKTKIDLVKEVRKFHEPVLAPDFSALDFVNVNENKVSEILAYFLNPKGNHGQGKVFLEQFLIDLNIDFKHENFSNSKVFTEFGTEEGRRIDILVKSDLNSLIAIENKINRGTADQPNQVYDYIRQIKKQTQNWVLIYLAPKTKYLSFESLSEELQNQYKDRKQLYLLNYEDNLLPIIKKWASLSQNERVRAFINDFEKTLKERYMSQKQLDEKELVSEYILNEPKNFEIAQMISQSLQIAKEKAKMEWKHQAAKVCEKHNLTFDIEKCIAKLPELENLEFAFDLELPNFEVGLKKVDVKIPSSNLEGLGSVDGIKWQSTEYWPKYVVFYDNYLSNPTFYRELKNNAFKDKIERLLKVILVTATNGKP